MVLPNNSVMNTRIATLETERFSLAFVTSAYNNWLTDLYIILWYIHRPVLFLYAAFEWNHEKLSLPVQLITGFCHYNL